MRHRIIVTTVCNRVREVKTHWTPDGFVKITQEYHAAPESTIIKVGVIPTKKQARAMAARKALQEMFSHLQPSLDNENFVDSF